MTRSVLDPEHRERVLAGPPHRLGQHAERVPEVVGVDVVEHLDADLPDRVVPERRERGGCPPEDARGVDDQQDVRRGVDRDLGEVHERPHRPRRPGVEGAGRRSAPHCGAAEGRLRRLNVTPPLHHERMATAAVCFHPAFERVLRNVVRDVAQGPVVLTVPEQIDSEVLAAQVLRYARVTRRQLEVRAEPGCVRVRLAGKGGRASA